MTLKGVTSDRHPLQCLQCPEAPVICQFNTKVAAHGSQATAYLGPSKRTSGALGRRKPSDAEWWRDAVERIGRTDE